MFSFTFQEQKYLNMFTVQAVDDVYHTVLVF